MKTPNSDQFDKEDEDIVDALISRGISEQVATMLVYFQVNIVKSNKVSFKDRLNEILEQLEKTATKNGG